MCYKCNIYNMPTKVSSDPVAEAFGLIHRHPSGENLLSDSHGISVNYVDIGAGVYSPKLHSLE